MATPTLSSTCFALAGLAALSAGSVSAQQVSVNPFMPPSNSAAGAPTAGAPIEFRGYMEDSGGVRFRLYDPARKTGSWVKLNERDSTLDVVAKQFNGGDNETLVVEMQGRTFTLAQRTAKVASSGSAAANVPPAMTIAPAGNVPPAVTQAVVVNPTPADEAKRLEAVASEVARRRALREQAANGTAPPQAQPQPQPAPQPQAQPNSNQQRPQRR